MKIELHDINQKAKHQVKNSKKGARTARTPIYYTFQNNIQFYRDTDNDDIIF